MGFYEIDSEKCRKDGICAAECPLKLLEMNDPSIPPTPVDGAEQRCVRCGHCVAVCPHGAFSLSEMKTEDCPPLQNDMLLGAEQAEHFLRSRRSIRNYKEKAIEQEKLAKIIDIARYAPTATNSQQLKWLVINSREGVCNLTSKVIDMARYLIQQKDPIAERYRFPGIVRAWEAGIDIITRGAPALVIVHAPSEYAFAQVDTAIALTFLDLAAPSFGLGTCWAGFFMIAAAKWPSLQESLAFPEGNVCFGAMMIGYPRYKYHRLPLRKAADITWR